MEFEWDQEKAKKSHKKHRVLFEEASTVFYNILSATFEDPDHSIGEHRLITIGYSSSVRDLQPHERGRNMKAKARNITDELRSEYDFDYSKAVRGKYHKRLSDEGVNIVVLEPDVAKAFSTSTAVNEALRSLLKLTHSTQRLTSRSSGRAKARH